MKSKRLLISWPLIGPSKRYSTFIALPRDTRFTLVFMTMSSCMHANVHSSLSVSNVFTRFNVVILQCHWRILNWNIRENFIFINLNIHPFMCNRRLNLASDEIFKIKSLYNVYASHIKKRNRWNNVSEQSFTFSDSNYNLIKEQLLPT